MADRVQTSNNLIVREKWSVAFPKVYFSIESGIFHLNGKPWKFKLSALPKATEEWMMFIIKCGNVDTNDRFCLTAYVSDGTSDYCMTHIEITSDTHKIWTHTRDSFLASYPSIKITGKIDFSFVIVNLRKDSQTFVNELVQTPPYLDDRLCLNNLSLALRKLVDEGSDSDVQLKCGECSIATHKLILVARSEVFRTMLQSDVQEGRQGVIDIVDMEPKICDIFIRYLYTGSLPVLSEDTATSLYEAADKYHVVALRERCGDFLAGHLTRENALGILAMADAHSDKDLKDKVVTYVLNENIPRNEVEWSKFCDDYPKLAIEVLNRSYSQASCSQ